MTQPPDAAPRISVILAGYNAAATVEVALASVLEQHDVSLECVVVDDGSTDATPAIVEAIAARDSRVRPVRLDVNAGVSVARNRALEVARGEWLAFLDADDRLMPGSLGRMLRAADEGDLLAVVGQRISTDGQRSWFPALYEKDDIRRAGRKSLAANPDLLYYVGPAGKLFHRSVAAGLQFEGRMLGDQPWVVRALVAAGDRIGVIEDVVYEWRRPHPDHHVATITSARTDSAALGIEAVTMAAIAFDAASAAFARSYDAATRARLDGVYAGRLVRADLAAQVRGAARRDDPDLGGLLLALAGFVAHLPADAVAATDAVATDLLEPVALRWNAIGASAKDAFWVLLEAARRADPRVPGRGRWLPVGIAFRLAAIPGVGRPACGLLLTVTSAGASAARGIRGRPAGAPVGGSS